MFKGAYDCIVNPFVVKSKKAFLQDKDVLIIFPLKDNPPYKGYLSVWAFKFYCTVVWNSWKILISNMRVGNVFRTLLAIPQTLVDCIHQVNMNLDSYRINMLDAYYHLVEEVV